MVEVAKIPLRADIQCSDAESPVGQALYVIVNPVTEQATHLVVRDRQRSGVERLVPLELVTETAPKRIWLRCTKSEFRALRPFVESEFLWPNRPLAGYNADEIRVTPYATCSELGNGGQADMAIHPAELAVRRGSSVETPDGPIGTVDEFVVDPADGGVTHLVLRRKGSCGDRAVAIPVSEIERIRGNVVYLRLSKLGVGALPRVSLLRKWA